MTVRQIGRDERFESALVSAVSFHSRIEDPDKARLAAAERTDEDWGAFAEDGRLMAHIVNNHFETNLNSRTVTCGGIGGVSTLPEYRESGAIRAIFGQLLPAAYKRGEVVSALYPFDHGFYRKFGYEIVCCQNVYTFAPGVIRDYRFHGEARLWKTGDSVSEYTDVYTRFAAPYNLAMKRDDEIMLRRIRGEYYKDRKFAYMLYEAEKPAAYVIFQDVRHEPSPLLSVRDAAWIDRAGFNALLGFLARFSADYGTIELPMPRGLELYSMLRVPRIYDVAKKTKQNFMVRVVNAEKLLALLKVPHGESFVIGISDGMLPKNSGRWMVSDGAAERTDARPDLTVSERALAQLAVGAVSLDEAAYRDDVEILSREATLARVFMRRTIHVADYF